MTHPTDAARMGSADLVPATGRVHWVGTGMSSGSGLGLVCSAATTVLWGRTRAKAERRLAELGLTGQAAVRDFTYDALAEQLGEGDVLVSMLPATEHPAMVRLAVEHGAHFVCSSYLSPGIAAQASAAITRGLVILTEVGLDPGIDHLLAHRLVTQAAAVLADRPATARFTSYCGSNPAVPNNFRYRLSWAPRGVLTALLTPARLIDDGVVTEVAHPWEAVRALQVNGETFEVYPNRDSLPFVQTYHFPETWTLETFARGTMRLDGWSVAWREVFEELPDATEERITELATDLARRYPTSATDYDRVVMSVALTVRAQDGTAWQGEYILGAVGSDREAATPRLVSVPLACGILDVLHSRVLPGVHQATGDASSIERWLAFLAAQDIVVEYRG